MTASNSGRMNFSDLLDKKIGTGLQPLSNIGGINPKQMSGVGISGITPNAPKGNIINTGNPLDLAIDGDGYFVLSDGKQNIYTHSVALKVDANSSLVDSVTGYTIQRIGSDGEKDCFQAPGDNNVRVPYGAVMSANRTSEIKVSGNLSSDATLVGGPQTQKIASNMTYTSNGGTIATASVELDQLDQFNGGSGTDGRLGVGESGTIIISGYNPNGTAFSSGLTFSVNPTTTLGDFINHLNTKVISGATASLVGGKIQITDDTGGCSRTDISLSYSGNGSLTMPGYFEILTVGGEEVKNAGITIYDSQGSRHVLTGAFVRGIKPNTWDMVLKSVTGDVSEIPMTNRRINNICFNASDGSYAGLSGLDSPQFIITFAHDVENPQTIKVQMGTVCGLDGLTLFKGSSTAAASEQDGYEAGRLSTVSVDNEGVIIGGFSNGIEKNIARLRLALLENASGLESIGGGYFVPSANSSHAVSAGNLADGAGTVHSGVLKKPDVTVATEFVNMIQVRNGFQTNVRTISVANEILREMSNLFG
ncbi:MAG: flagellar hook-basal body complex protein [Phycisphaerae bacterium]|nr:flagellar hook-basal body complex protein [Phycisphaerae bacterium]